MGNIAAFPAIAMAPEKSYIFRFPMLPCIQNENLKPFEHRNSYENFPENKIGNS